MLGSRAQVGTEYVVITAFLLIIITAIFTYSYVTQDQEIKISQANNVLDEISNKIAFVYALGEGNSKIAEVSIPGNVLSATIVHKCVNGEQGEGDTFCDDKDGIRFSALQMTVALMAGETAITRVAKYRLVFENDEQGNAFPCATPDTFCQGGYKIMAKWDTGEQQIVLKRVD